MYDQADKLRKLLNKSSFNIQDKKYFKRTNTTRILTITSGKGGVGKSNFTVNLAISLSNLGYSVVVIDADIGLANIDVLLGIIPKDNISSVINKRKSITDIMIEGPNGIKVVAGGSGLYDLFQLNNENLEYLIDQLVFLENICDFILIDTGAGISENVMSFIGASDEVILVTTPEPTSLTDAYALLKSIKIKGIVCNLHLVVNRVESQKEALSIYEKLNIATNKFLDMKINNLGYLINNKVVVESVKMQTPFINSYPNSVVSKSINSMAAKIVGRWDLATEGRSLVGFVNKFKAYFQSKNF